MTIRPAHKTSEQRTTLPRARIRRFVGQHRRKLQPRLRQAGIVSNEVWKVCKCNGSLVMTQSPAHKRWGSFFTQPCAPIRRFVGQHRRLVVLHAMVSISAASYLASFVLTSDHERRLLPIVQVQQLEDCSDEPASINLSGIPSRVNFVSQAMHTAVGGSPGAMKPTLKLGN